MDSHRYCSGMAGLPVFPFPGLNPWNWGAMSPVHTFAAAVVAARCGADLWWSAMNATQHALRHYQDATLDALLSQLTALDRAGGAAPPAPPATWAPPRRVN